MCDNQHTVIRHCFVGKKKKKREELFMHSLDSVMCVRCKRRIGSVIIILPELERIKRMTDNETITIHEMMSLMLQHIESV